MATYCTHCYNRGILFARKKNEHRGNEAAYVCVFRCDCSWASGDPRPYARWNSHYASIYEIDDGKSPKELVKEVPEPVSIPIAQEPYKQNVTPLLAPMAEPKDEPSADFFDAPYTDELF